MVFQVARIIDDRQIRKRDETNTAQNIITLVMRDRKTLPNRLTKPKVGLGLPAQYVIFRITTQMLITGSICFNLSSQAIKLLYAAEGVIYFTIELMIFVKKKKHYFTRNNICIVYITF